ncbi:MAG: hypothetical protein WA910_00865, partial [Sphingopyxis granuli]
PTLLPLAPTLRPPLLLRPPTPLLLRPKRRSKSQPFGASTERKEAVFPMGRPPFSLGQSGPVNAER